MENYKTIEIEVRDEVATCWLNRPKIRNAFNEVMISELKHFFLEASENNKYRVIILRGRGKSFCSGADLEWMKSVVNYSDQQNFHESMQLSECLHAIYSCKIPTIAAVHGAAIGGANGLLSACDIAVADDDTVFSLSEVKIGIIPACISPYVIKRIGEFPARELMISGRRFKAPEAEKKRLINKSLNISDLEEYLSKTSELILSSGPRAVQMCKELIYGVTNELTLNEAMEFTARMIADIRKSDEGQEGMNAFLEKRKPGWVKE